MKRLLFALAATASTVAMAPAANATALLNGQSGVAFTTFDISTQGTLLASSNLAAQASPTATYNAQFRTAVYRNTSGTLDFYYQLVANSINAQDEINGLSAFNFFGYTVDAMVATFDVDGAGGLFTAAANPNSDGPGGTSLGFTSTASRNGTGGTIRADFGQNGLEAAGETSAVYIFRTNATSFGSGTFTAQDGTTVTTIAFAPGVPEPATWAMLMLGFGAMGGMLRSRRRTTARIRFA